MKQLSAAAAAALVSVLIVGDARAGVPTTPNIDWMPSPVAPGAATLTWNMWWGTLGTYWEVWDGSTKLLTTSKFDTPYSDPNFTQKGSTTLSLTAGTRKLQVKLCNAAGCTPSTVTTISVTGDSGGSTTGGSTTGGSTTGGSTTGGSTAQLPGAPAIAWMDSTQTLPFNLSWNLWWGVTGTSWQLIDNGKVVQTSTGFTAATANTQAGSTTIASADGGKHSYVVALCNAAGCTNSAAVSVNLPAAPAAATYYLDAVSYLKTGRIDIGQARLANVWDQGPLSVQIPRERKVWAMALAHASQIFRNVTGIDDIYVQANHYLATAIQESRLGADPATSTFTFPFAIANAADKITYQPGAKLDGFFQIEGSGNQTSAFAELIKLFPSRFGNQDHDKTVSDDRFATSAITAAYYNMYMWYFLVGSGYNPSDFIKHAKDRQAFDKVMAMAYNRGLYSSYVSDVFVGKRTACLAMTDMADASGTCFPNANDYGSRYVRQVPGFNQGLVLAANGQLNKTSADYGETLEAYGAYDATISWAEISAYIDSVAQLYSAADIAKAKKDSQTAFNALAMNGTISFRTQFGPVLDAIVLALPVENPSAQLCAVYSKCATETASSASTTSGTGSTSSSSTTGTTTTTTTTGSTTTGSTTTGSTTTSSTTTGSTSTGSTSSGSSSTTTAVSLAACQTALIGKPVAANCLTALDQAKFGGATGRPTSTDREIITYFAEWGTYGRNFQPADLAAAKLTRINYAFLNYDTAGNLKLFDSYAATDKAFATDGWDSGMQRGLFKQFWLLKQRFPHLKLYVSVGGWTLTSGFPALANDPSARGHFADSVLAFLQQYGFDGVDIDWEYPAYTGGNVTPLANDRNNFTALIKALHDKLAPLGYGVSFAAGAAPGAISALDYQALAPLVTSINLMTYDFNGTWSTQVGHNAPLYNNRGIGEEQSFTVNDAVLNVLAAMQGKAVPKSATPYATRQALLTNTAADLKRKVVVGVPFYGRGWINVDQDPTEANIWVHGNGAAPGSFEAGMADAKDLINPTSGKLANWLPANPSRLWDSHACVPMLYGVGKTGGRFVYSYDDEQSLQWKGKYAGDSGLGGVMVWEASGEPTDHSLLTALAAGLAGQTPGSVCITGGTDSGN